MQVVKGIYKGGTIRLLEPVDLPEQQEVTVVIVPAEGAAEHPALRYAGMLSDLTPQEQQAFDEALKQRLPFHRPLKL